MFQKMLVADRGEIALRVIRACKDLGVKTVALCEAENRASLHVRLADECVPITAESGFQDQETLLKIAKEAGVDAIHPGSGCLTERLDFVQNCETNGIVFIGPDRETLERLRNHSLVLQRARTQGISTLLTSGFTFGLDEFENMSAEAKGFAPAHRVSVQVLGDHHGNRLHLGERDSSLQFQRQRFIEETPSPCLTTTQREILWQEAVEVASLFDLRGLNDILFWVGQDGQFVFTGIKAGLQGGHPVTEVVSSIDLVAEQIRIAAGEVLKHRQNDIHLRGWGLQCQINIVDPPRDLVPNPGHIQHVRLPSGAFVRVDTYLGCESDVSTSYDPTLAKLIVFGTNREECIQRMRRALDEFNVIGVLSNKVIHQRLMENMDFICGNYTVETLFRFSQENEDIFSRAAKEIQLRDLAVAVAISFVKRNTVLKPSIPERLLTGWHRDSRRWKP